MNQSYTDHDTVTYFGSIGNVMRILYDFESYNVVRENWGLKKKEESETLLFAKILEHYGKYSDELKGVPPKADRMMQRERERQEAKRQYQMK